jgi:hypothetical protein
LADSSPPPLLRVSEMEHHVFRGRRAAEAGEEEQRIGAWIRELDTGNQWEAKRRKRSDALCMSEQILAWVSRWRWRDNIC